MNGDHEWSRNFVPICKLCGCDLILANMPNGPVNCRQFWEIKDRAKERREALDKSREP